MVSKRRTRVLLASLIHETNTFVEEPTSVSHFSWKVGKDMFLPSVDDSPFRAFMEVAQEKDWEVLPAVDARCMASGIVEDQVFEGYWELLRKEAKHYLEAGPIDAVVLILHGAMATRSVDDVEGVLAERLRTVPALKGLPFYGVLDLHGNFSERMAQHMNGWVAFRENPHTDAIECGRRVGLMLARYLESDRSTKVFWRRLPLLWPAIATATSASPMCEMEALAREIEKENPDVLAVNIMAGFAHADVPDAGVSINLTTTAGADKARWVLNRLANTAWALRETRYPSECPLSEAIEKARQGPFPALLVEPADNVGGGGPGDGTHVLRAMLAAGVDESAAVIYDPTSAAQAIQAGPGHELELKLGGKGSRLDAGPLRCQARVLAVSDGEFHLEDPQSHFAAMTGQRVRMGPSAVVLIGCVYVLITSIKTPPFDLGMWRSHGLNPEDFSLVNIKAAVAHRQAWAPVAAQEWTVDVPGPAMSDITRLPYRRVSRPVYPLDPMDQSPLLES